MEGTARTCPNLQSSELPMAPGRTTCLDRALARSPPSFRPKPRETIKPSLPPHDMGLSSNTDTIVMFSQTFHFNFAPAFVGAFCKVFSLIHDPVTPPQETREATTNKHRGQNWPKSLPKKGKQVRANIRIYSLKRFPKHQITSFHKHLAMNFLGVCNARRATHLVTEVCNGGPCYAGL